MKEIIIRWCKVWLFVIVLGASFEYRVALSQSWDTGIEDVKFAHPHWKDCKKKAPLTRAEYTEFAKKVFEDIERKKTGQVAKLCGDGQEDVVKEVVCNLGKYLLDNNDKRFAESAHRSSVRSKIFFYIDDIFLECPTKGQECHPLRFRGKTIFELYWDKLASLAKNGNREAFETMLCLADGADGWVAEELAIKLGGFFMGNPDRVSDYWGVLVAHKKSWSIMFDYMDFMVDQKFGTSCGDQQCKKVKDVFKRLGDLAGESGS